MSQTYPTFIHYLSEDSLFAKLPFWLKFGVFFVVGMIGVLSQHTALNLVLAVCFLSLLFAVKLHRSRKSPFFVLLFTAVTYSFFWLLASKVDGGTIYVRFPWGTYISEQTFVRLLSTVSRWTLILSSGFFFLSTTSERELLELLHRDSVPSSFTVAVTTAMNTLQFAIEDIERVNRSLVSRGIPTDGVRARARQGFYVAVALLLSNLKRIETLGQSYTLRRATDRSACEGERSLRVSIDRLGYDDGDPVIENLRFELSEGDVLGIYGSTGSGKTTLLGLLAGVYPELGNVTFEGTLVLNGTTIDPAALRSETAMSHQEPESQFLFTTVEKELLHGVEDPDVERRVFELLDYFGIEGSLSKSLSDLSTGQRKIISHISVLSSPKPLLVFDEPTANLDGEYTNRLFELLRNLDDKIVVVSTHSPRKVPVSLCDETIRSSRPNPSDGDDPTATEIDRPTPRDDEESEPTPLVSLDDVAYEYPDGTTPFEAVSFEVYRGEILGVLGDNGSGKTTVLELLVGQRDPTRGSVVRHGSDPSVAYLHQEPDKQLFTGSVADEIRFGSDDVSEAKVEEILDVTGLAEVRDRHPFFLSRGQKQLLLVSALLVSQPDVLVLDEPFTGLDDESMRIVSELIVETHRELSPTVVMTDQSHDQLGSIVDRTIRVGSAVEADRQRPESESTDRSVSGRNP